MAVADKKRNINRKPNIFAPGRIKKEIRFRVGILYIVFGIVSLSILVQVALIQFGPNSRGLRNLSDDRFYELKPTYASRGNILSCDGRILATDSPLYSVALNFTLPKLTSAYFNGNVGAVSDSLAHLLGQPSSHYRALLEAVWRNVRNRGPQRFEKPFLDNLDKLQVDRIAAMPLFDSLKGAMVVNKKDRRFNPYGRLGAYEIGSRNTMGIEHFYNDYLEGHNGVNRNLRLTQNVWVPVVDPDNRRAVNGCDVVTTIDVDWQDVVENELRRQLSDAGAVCGTAVVMEVETGEIKALSILDNPEVMPSGYSQFYFTTLRNEPGSTFKLMSLMALFEKGGYTIDTEVDCSTARSVMVGRKSVSDTHPVGVATVKRMMAESSNVGFARAVYDAFKGRDSVFTNFIRSTGITEVSDLQLIKGYAPRLPDPSKGYRDGWYKDISLPMLAYGYVVEVTPMHTLMLYNAVANGGKMITPVLVKEIRDNGVTVERFSTRVVNDKICSTHTLNEVRECLEAVVSEGTGKALHNEHFAVAGKTGTAQVAQGGSGYSIAGGGTEYLATFVGYFPADKPKYSCIVAIRTRTSPSNRNIYYGAALAGPVFAKITERVYALETEWRAYIPKRSERIDSTKVKGGSVRQLRTAADRLGIENDIGAGQRGFASADCANELTVDKITVEQGVMPSVVGMGLKDALYLLEKCGLDVRISGKGRVTGQSVAAGQRVAVGQRVDLVLN